MNFILSRKNYLPYYLPLIIEGNKLNLKSTIYFRNNIKKFVNPYENIDEFNILSKQYNFDIKPLDEIKNVIGNIFVVEGDIVGTKGVKENCFLYQKNENQKIISLVCNYEFAMFYNQYISLVDYVIFPTKYYAEKYKTLSSKNLYLGSPKYSLEVKNTHFNLPNEYKYCLFFFPKNPTQHKKPNTLYPTKTQILNIYSYLNKLGYKIIVKTREQDRILDSELKGDYYFEDFIYPTSSMELITIADFSICFSSSLIEECVFLKKPFIDFKVDLKKDRFKFLYQKEYSCQLKLDVDFQTFEQNLKSILNCESKYFDNILNKYFNDYLNCNKLIIKYFNFN
jgi:hypothetical protein